VDISGGEAKAQNLVVIVVVMVTRVSGGAPLEQFDHGREEGGEKKRRIEGEKDCVCHGIVITIIITIIKS